MADPKGNDPKPGQPADTRSGAVKPPVLDLTARETPAAAGKPDPAKPELAKSDPAKSETKVDAKPTIKPATVIPPTASKPADGPRPGVAAAERGFPFGAAITGALLGLAAAYGLALAGYWPAPPLPTPQADPRLAQFASAIPELETVTQTTQSELAALNQRIAALETAEPPAVAGTAPPAVGTPEPVDLAPIQAEIAALNERIAAIPTQTAAPVDLDGLTGDITGLGARLDELAARLGTAEAGLRTLDTTIGETSAALAQQPSDIGAVLQLPLILSGLETAFNSGRPFETELGALRAAAPGAQVPNSLAAAAPAGLPRPDEIATSFADALPAIIAGRPADPDGQWQDSALDWFSSAIALRRTGEQDGDAPEAVTSRLEGAIARRDWTAAQELFAALPPPMQAAAGAVPALVARQAEAARLLETIRAQALSGEAAP